MAFTNQYMTALLEEAALFILGNECNSPAAPSDVDRLVSGYRTTQTASPGDGKRFRPPYVGIPHYSDRLIGGRQAILTAFYRDTALLRPPYRGTASDVDRLVSGYRTTQTALSGDGKRC